MAIVVKPAPWYRRIFHRQRHALTAGERPRELGTGGRFHRPRLGTLIILAVVLIVVGGVAAYASIPDIRDRVNSIIDDVQGKTHPGQVIHADATAPGPTGHDGSKAVDENLATWWSANPAKQPTLAVTFQSPIDLHAVNFYSGPDKAQVDPLSEQRPQHVQILAPDGSSTTLELKDTDQIQTFPVNMPGVSRLSVVILDTYTTGGGKTVALREVEFVGVPAVAPSPPH